MDRIRIVRMTINGVTVKDDLKDAIEREKIKQGKKPDPRNLNPEELKDPIYLYTDGTEDF